MSETLNESPSPAGTGMWRMSRVGLIGLLLLAMYGLSACGGGSDGDSAPTASATIGALGGTVVGPDGAQVVIPPGALTQDTVISIARTASGAPTDYPHDTPPVGATYEFTPHDILFQRPVTISLPAPAGGAAQDTSVLSSSPTLPWHVMQATRSGNSLTWQSTSFSWNGYAGFCSVSAGVALGDPYPCASIGAGVNATSVPSTALTEFGNPGYQKNYRSWYFTGSPQVKITASFTVARDCGDPTVDVRQFFADGTGPTLTHPAVVLLPVSGSTNTSSGTVTVNIGLADTPNRTTAVSFLFSCERAFQYPPPQASVSGWQRRTTLLEVAEFSPDPNPPALAAPVIAQQPADLTVAPAADATFTVAATGNPAPTVQWQRSNDGGASWADIPGATGSSYTLSAASSTDNGSQFRAVVSNSQGSVTSKAATLSVVSAVTAQWQTATDLRAPTTLTQSSDIRVSAGANGNLIAIWTDSYNASPYTRTVRTSRYTAGVGWSAPETIVAADNEVISRPVVALQSDGRAVAIFARGAANARSLYTSEQPLGGSWSTPTLVSNLPGDTVEPALVVDGLDTATTVWIDIDTTTGNYPVLYTSRKPAGGAWSTPLALGYTRDASRTTTRMAANVMGDVVLSYTNADTTTGSPAAAVYRAGTGWSAARVFTSQEANQVTDVAINDSGLAVVALAGGTQPAVARSVSGGAWAAPEPSGVSATVAVTASGTVQVAGSIVTAGVPAVIYAESVAGGAFSPPTSLVNGAATSLLRVDALGNSLIVCGESVNGVPTLYAIRRPVGGSWGNPVLIETQTSTNSYIGIGGNGTGGTDGGQLAVSSNGDAAVVWLEAYPASSPFAGSPADPWANVFLH